MPARSIQRIDGKTAQEFGIEVRGLLGHDIAGEGNFTQLTQRDGIGQESHVRFSSRETCSSRFAGIAQIAQVLLLKNRFRGDAQQLFQHQRVQLRQIELRRCRSGSLASAWATTSGFAASR
jgi:hypothetical protein